VLCALYIKKSLKGQWPMTISVVLVAQHKKFEDAIRWEGIGIL